MPEVPATDGSARREKTRQALVIGALGVVFGDIGTSPLYTLRQCFTMIGTSSGEVVLGVLSLVFWALLLVVTMKYVLVMMRADNHGEGGILALTTLVLRATHGTRAWHRWVVTAGLIGASLFYGDAIITPAISVLSAVEGLKVATPALDDYVMPVAAVLLVLIFAMQSRGTSRVGNLFGPVMLLWFVALATLGGIQVARHPGVLAAVNPVHAVSLFAQAPGAGFVLLGAVVLAVTGAEALYADMGHFGPQPIRTTWLWIVFPALLLNYFGQGALLLETPEAIANPFFYLAPSWALLPLVLLASMATIIASQAVISGAFSITRQAVQLGYLPRLEVRHTSAEEIGQVYVPRINGMLLVAVLAVVLGFRSSDNLGAAYGLAVTGTMTITTVLAFLYLRTLEGWGFARAGILFAALLVVDLAFFGANLFKLADGGWFSVAIAAAVYTIMSTWRWGRRQLLERRARQTLTVEEFLANLKPDRSPRVPGTAIFLTGNAGVIPGALLHNLKHNKVLHERVVLMTVRTDEVPRVPDAERLEIRRLKDSVLTITVHYGFMEQPNIPRALAQCRAQNVRFNLMETSFFVGREKIVPTKRRGPARWRKELFVFMSNNMLDATEFFRIPSNRVVELGGQVEV